MPIFLVVMRAIHVKEFRLFFFLLDCLADVNIESPPSMHPCKRICDITGFEVCSDLYFSC